MWFQKKSISKWIQDQKNHEGFSKISLNRLQTVLLTAGWNKYTGISVS